MTTKQLLELAKSVLTLPTAPYHEHAVRTRVEEFCRGLGLRAARDRAGNVIVRYRHRTQGAPLVFVAHMDHPGFEALGGGRAEFFGGVPQELFKGAPVRFFTDGRVVRASVTGVNASQWSRRKLVRLRVAGKLAKGAFGMWDVPAFRVRAGKLHAAAIDDGLSVAVLLATLAEIKRRKLATHVWAVFTRAEEVGFQGAVAVAKAGKIPRQAVVISMEMSRERPWARMGDGPVVRVGDRLTTFDGPATLFLQEAARRSAVQAQRCLMDGGSCEATAFSAYGYRVGGLCLPLGNYHNIGKGGRIRAEYVSVQDLTRLLELTVAAAAEWRGFAGVSPALRARVERIQAAAPRKLRSS